MSDQDAIRTALVKKVSEALHIAIRSGVGENNRPAGTIDCVRLAEYVHDAALVDLPARLAAADRLAAAFHDYWDARVARTTEQRTEAIETAKRVHRALRDYELSK